jgi:hypothetical protein
MNPDIKCAEIRTREGKMADFGTAPKKETVFQGQPDQTIYNGAAAAKPAQAKPAALPGQVSPAVRGGASWFYWIGALSVINTLISMSGNGTRFIFGLGITQFTDAVGAHGGGSGSAAALVVTVVIAGVFAIFGYFGGQGQKWAFLVGMILYAVDAGLCVLVGIILSAAFHAWALFRMYGGFKAID